MSDPVHSASGGRRALRRGMLHAAIALGAAVALAAAVNAGAGILGPALIVVGAYGGGRALRDWWRHLDEQWFVAEIALVSIGWALLAGAFATFQYVTFSFAPGAFLVDLDYAQLVSPRYREAWSRDSVRAAAALRDLDQADRLLRAVGPDRLVLDSLYPLGGDGSARLAENCEDQTLFERCPWQMAVVTAPEAEPILVPVTPPKGDRESVSRAELARQLEEAMAHLRGDLADYARRIADPAPFVQPGLADFLYDTVVAFVGTDAGIFQPISVLARVCKILEFLASLLLFGAVVARLSAAAGARTARP